jgi:flagellar basal-body rod modification protein FlgD
MASSIVSPTQSLSNAMPSTSSSSSPTDSLTSEDTFLKLLVSQIQNQDPMNPADGVQFLTQLTGYSQLEQLMQINQELAPQPAPSNTANSANSSSTNPVS